MTATVWGDEEHEAIGLIAEHYSKTRGPCPIQALQARDHSDLTPDAASDWAPPIRPTRPRQYVPEVRQALWQQLADLPTNFR